MIGLPTIVDLEDLVARRPRPRAAASPINASTARAHGARQLLVAAGVHHHIGDAAHQILAEADLRVHRADARRATSPVCEIAEMRGDRGRADVEGDAERAVGEARHRRATISSALAHRDGDLPLARAQRLLQAAQHRQARRRLAEAPLRAAAPAAAGAGRWRGRACRARRPRRNAAARRDRSRSDGSRRACARPADAPGFPAARRRRDRRRCAPGSRAGGPARSAPRLSA